MSILSQVNLDQALTQEEYVEQLVSNQVALGQLGYQVYVQKRPVIIVFEGWDAAGKGGAIKRLTERLDPRGYAVYPIAAPTGEDKTHHYLYRFWRRLPERGQIAVFDRSWYGRVMVERVEGFCNKTEWSRAYREINQFERQLVDFGAIIFKFWLHLSKAEQLRRFQERAATPYKAWKLTEEDWRNREEWELYEAAVEEMLLRTSTLTAPWTIVEGTDKRWARVKVLRTVVEGLSKELGFEPAVPGKKPAKASKSKIRERGQKLAAASQPEAGVRKTPVAGTAARAKSKIPESGKEGKEQKQGQTGPNTGAPAKGKKPPARLPVRPGAQPAPTPLQGPGRAEKL